MNCVDESRDEIIERYAAGRLVDDEREAFEEHLLGCDRCQEGVRLAAAIRAELQTSASTRSGRPWRWAALAVAAAITAIVILPRLGSNSELTQLGGVAEPPIWLGVSVRAGERASADSLFEAAMTAYDERRWRDAVRGLESAVTAGAELVPTSFFLGASELLRGETERAKAAFDAVIRAGDSPYLAEARYYRAKALLRQGRAEAALFDLDLVAGSSGPIAPAARALADSVREITTR